MPAPSPSPPSWSPPPPVGAAGLRRRLAAGFGALGGAFVLTTALHLLLVPILIGAWGAAGYGAWLALGAAAGLLSMLDFGVQVHLTSLMRRAAARGDQAAFARVLADGLGLYLAMAGLGLAVVGGGVLGLDLPRRLGIADPQATPAALLLGAVTVLLLPRGLVGCVFSARGDLPREVALATAATLAPLAAVAGTALAGGGLAAAAAAHAAAALLAGWGLLLASLRRRHPDLTLRPRWPQRSALAGYLRRAALHGVGGGAGILALHAPVLILQALAPAGPAVAIFATMRTFAGLLRQAATQVTVGAGLEMVRQHAQGDHAGLDRLFRSTARLTGGGLGLAAAGLAAVGEPFFALWTRGEIAFDPSLALPLLGVVVAMAPALTAQVVLRHTDHAEVLARAALAQAGLACAGCLALVPALGALGAAWAVAMAELATMGWLALTGARHAFALRLGRPLAAAWGAALAGLAWGALAWIVLAWTALAWGEWAGGQSPQPAGAGGLLLYATAWAVLAAPAAPFILFDAPARTWTWRRLRGRD